MIEYKIDDNSNNENLIINISGVIRSDESLEKFEKLISIVSDKVINNKMNIFFDFSKIKLINSSGIGKLLMFNNYLKDHSCKLFLLNVTISIKQLLKFARVDESLPMVSSVSEVSNE